MFKPVWKILDELSKEAHSELNTDSKNIYTSKNFKKEVECVKTVFNPKILSELPIEEVSEPETDTRITRMSRNYKKEVKSVTCV